MGNRAGRRRRHKRHKAEASLQRAWKETFLTPTVWWRTLPPGSFVFDEFAWSPTPETWAKIKPALARLGFIFAVCGVTRG